MIQRETDVWHPISNAGFKVEVVVNFAHAYDRKMILLSEVSHTAAPLFAADETATPASSPAQTSPTHEKLTLCTGLLVFWTEKQKTHSTDGLVLDSS